MGHVIGNALKSAMSRMPTWPEKLDLMRHLCGFFRNESWRARIIRLLAPTVPNVRIWLHSLNASLAKWRFHTICLVQEALLRVREFCQNHMRRELFNSFDDTALMGKVIEACRNENFWRWLAGSHRYVVRPFENLCLR